MKMVKLKYLMVWGILMMLTMHLFASESHLLPLPQKAIFSSSSFVIGEAELQTSILTDDWKQLWKSWGGTFKERSNRMVAVRLVDKLEGIPLNREEAYRLNITAREIRIEAETERGIYWAMQTLRQLAETKKGKVRLKGCEITDWPAFRIRGFMQDVGRT